MTFKTRLFLSRHSTTKGCTHAYNPWNTKIAFIFTVYFWVTLVTRKKQKKNFCHIIWIQNLFYCILLGSLGQFGCKKAKEKHFSIFQQTIFSHYTDNYGLYIETVGLTMCNFDGHLFRSDFLYICKSYQSQGYELRDREILALKKCSRADMFYASTFQVTRLFLVNRITYPGYYQLVKNNNSYDWILSQ